MEIIRLNTADSTNDEAQRRLEAGTAKIGDVIVADAQEGGHGRLGRPFTSPVGGLYMTVICPGNMNMPTVRAAVAVNNAVKAKFGLESKIKWVNDILVDDKKICGILSCGIPKELVSDEKIDVDNGSKEFDLGAIIVGIGINLAKQDFMDEIGAGFIDTGLEAGTEEFFALRDELAETIAKALLDERSSEEIIAEYKEASCLIGKRINVYKHGLDHAPMLADVLDIDETGGLKVKYIVKARHGTSGFEGGRETLRSGEISIRLN